MAAPITDRSQASATVAVNIAYPQLVETVQEALVGEVVVATDDPRASDAEILLAFDRTPDAVRSAVTPSVRWIHVGTAGIDGFPLELVGERVLTCARGATAVPIAEWTMAMVLAHAKRLPASWVDEAPERWGYVELDSVAGATLALVGVGAIGTEVARRALAFDMEVVGFRRRALPAPIEGMTMAGTLAELLERADHVVVAAPATAATQHLLGAVELARMKPTAHLVNIARGSLVDQDALLAALDAEQLAGASLDVTDPEPLPAGHPLYAHPKVRLSPHISWSGSQAGGSSIGLFTENVRRYRAGEDLHGVVDVDAGY
jgi:phosphoglycerate dehydrogenase-like enzyme